MMKSLRTAASGMGAQQRRLDVTANNIANVSTTGFKASRAEFQELLYTEERSAGNPDADGNPTALQVGSGVRTASTQRNFSQGTLESTGNALDLAIEGPGFFEVIDSNGNTVYTRAGAFNINANGALVNSDGHPMNPPITIPPDATAVTVGRDGVVSVRQADDVAEIEVGRIELTTFTNPAGLRSLGRNLFEATEAAGRPQIGRPGERGVGSLTQGFLEGSNVEMTEEMIDMIVSQRAYEINSKVIRTADEMLRSVTNIR